MEIFMANHYDEILKSMNREKLEELKKKTENGELSEMLNSIDTDKAEKMMKDFGLAEKAKYADIGKLIKEVQSNPTLLEKLKSLF